MTSSEFYERDSLWGERYEEPAEAARAAWTARMLPESGGVIVEIGAGAGIVTKAVRDLRKGSEVVALDLAFGAVRRAGYPAVVASAAALPIRPGAVTAVIAAEVIEHLSRSDLRSVVDEVERLRPNSVVVTVPNREVLSATMVACAECGCIFNPWRHTRSFSSRDLPSLFGANYRLVREEEAGPSMRYVPHLFAVLAQAFGGFNAISPNGTRCPSCGNETDFVSERNLWTRIMRGFFSRFARTRDHFWLGAVYDRVGEETSAPS